MYVCMYVWMDGERNEGEMKGWIHTHVHTYIDLCTCALYTDTWIFGPSVYMYDPSTFVHTNISHQALPSSTIKRRRWSSPLETW